MSTQMAQQNSLKCDKHQHFYLGKVKIECFTFSSVAIFVNINPSKSEPIISLYLSHLPRNAVNKLCNSVPN